MRRKLLSLVLALVLCLGLTVPVMALNSGEEWMGDFVVNGDTLVKYYGDGGAVTIPDGITTIGDNAFEICDKLVSVTIPSSVTTIGFYAFGGCTNLTSVTIPDSVTSIGREAFRGCRSLTGVTIPYGVAAIEDRTFEGCAGLASVTIPASVTSIGGNAFQGCGSLTGITIPSSVTSIGQGAFTGGTFKGCTSLTSVTIPDGVTRIEGALFEGCTSLTSVTIPSSVTSIGDGAFYGCTSLTNVTIPDGVSGIRRVFEGCTSLKSVTIPASVTDIYGAFDHCNSLTDIYYGGSKAQWNALRGESAIEKTETNPVLHFNSTGPAVQPAAPDAPAAPETPAAPAGLTVNPNSSTVLVNGKNVSFDAYTIEGSNYFKLRDLAYVLNGTEKQFEVGWDNASKTITLTSGQSYTAAGGEMAAKGSGAQSASVSASKLLIDGKEVALTAYTINGNNYFKLRDIGQALDFGIGWDNASKTITIDTSTGYTA